MSTLNLQQRIYLFVVGNYCVTTESVVARFISSSLDEITKSLETLQRAGKIAREGNEWVVVE